MPKSMPHENETSKNIEGEMAHHSQSALAFHCALVVNNFVDGKFLLERDE
jgi:hypothetical protein